MSINSVNYGNSVLNQNLLDLKNQLTTLQTQLASGLKSTTYAGMGVNEGFAIAARSQLASISGFTNTMTNVTTNINVINTALQSMVDIGTTVKNSANSSNQALNSSGQTTGQQTALAQLSSMLDILNTQSGNSYVFSGSATNTPSVASSNDILNGTTTQAGLKQVISERALADGTTGLGRLVTTVPAAAPATPASVQVAEDAPGSPFGLKLNSISSWKGSNVTGPTGSPPAMSVDLAGTNPNIGDQVSFKFNLPDGTTESIQLTASSANPPPAGSFFVDASPTLTAGNLNVALNKAITTLASTSLVAASAVAASDNFFNPSGAATGSAVNNQAAPPAPISGATLLSGTTGSDSLTTRFAAGDTITVNGTPITFVPSGATGNQLNITDSVQTLLSKIDSITGTSTPSTISGGAITLRTDNATTVTSSNPTAFAALGFGATVTTTQAPLRVSTPFGSATSYYNGTANTVAWYTGNRGAPNAARASSSALVDQSLTVQYGAQANEQAIRSQLQNIAVFAAFTASPTAGNSAAQNATQMAAQVAALSERVGQNLSAQPGHQTIQNIQTDFATAQTIMKDAGARQTQTQTMLQNMVAQTETVSSDQVASEILALQTNLQASYQTTAMLSQLTLTKYLPIA